MTACGEIVSAYLGTSLMSLLTNMFSPMDMPIALLVISILPVKAEDFFLPSCQCGKSCNSYWRSILMISYWEGALDEIPFPINMSD